MRAEIWDVLDGNGLPTGKTVLRGKCFLKPGEYHLVVHIWIVSPDGRLLLQRRSDQKKLMPGEWAATGGAAISGESSFSAAQRELYEELGISSTKETLKKVLRLKRRNSLLDIWAITLDIDPADLKLQKSEVAEARWVSVDELEDMIKNGLFHNYGKEYFEQVLSAVCGYEGACV
jgi:isopentenyldiphosphate isomerase